MLNYERVKSCHGPQDYARSPQNLIELTRGRSASDHDRFRGYVPVHCRSGLQPPCLRFATAVTGRHARFGSRCSLGFSAAVIADGRPSSQTVDFNALARRNPHRSRRALLTHRAPPSGQTLCDERLVTFVARRAAIIRSTRYFGSSEPWPPNGCSP
jgi:hypothetical protein